MTFAFHASAQRLPGSNVIYLNIPSFLAEGIAAEARSELLRVAGEGPVDGLIIDLRQNGGGFLSELRDTEKLFLDGGNGGDQFTARAGKPTRSPAARPWPPTATSRLWSWSAT